MNTTRGNSPYWEDRSHSRSSSMIDKDQSQTWTPRSFSTEVVLFIFTIKWLDWRQEIWKHNLRDEDSSMWKIMYLTSHKSRTSKLISIITSFIMLLTVFGPHSLALITLYVLVVKSSRSGHEESRQRSYHSWLLMNVLWLRVLGNVFLMESWSHPFQICNQHN